ncbi:phosphotyrosine protein phosphatase [Shewanella sp. A25]|nr:phosphotyrosine protein phosphatase [Shewanella shenzhenensis]
MNILFLCTSNLNRSRTAEDHFAAKDPLHVYRSAGLNEKECRRNSTTLCSEELLEWADVVFVMEDKHVRRIEKYTGQRFLGKVINLNIPDVYQYGESALIEQLEKRRDATQFES